ncbi:hypothetical protein DI392_05460 [Vibrio albus]|uniref:Glycosyltransferase n=1 Tax=Vibrio albus TaxID=2200953 RepID=A0A2U3BCS5_9VIBR|nr:glycosyltransferase family 4 protein [Vibrio albus]PWI34554.1 hypothetical protein DI392_05460 [Vibrio albus]
MKILIINTLYSPHKFGGAEVSVQLLAESLVSQGHTVKVLSLSENKEESLSSINGVDVCYLPLKNIYWPYSATYQSTWKRLLWHLIDQYNPLMSRAVAKHLDEFQPDVVHTNNLAGFTVSVWNEVKKRGIRLVHTGRDYYLFHPNCTLFKGDHNMEVSSFSVKGWSFFKKRLSRKIDAFVGISKFIADLHQKNGYAPTATFHTIYNPVKPVHIEKNIHIKKEKVIGFIGRLSVEKGFDVFCDIAEKYKERTDVRFVAAGEFSGSDTGSKLKNRAEKVGVNLLGFTPLETFLSQVDAVLLPTKWREPFGRVVVECSSYVPVFVQPVGGISELLELIDTVYDTALLEKFIVGELKASSYCPDPVFSTRSNCHLYERVYDENSSK